MAKKNFGSKKAPVGNTSSGFPEGEVVMRMIFQNKPLSTWRAFVDEGGDHGPTWSPKKGDKTAAMIYRQLSHPEAVKIVAHEWDRLGPDVRMQLGELARSGDGSNNVTKGCQELNRLIGGKLLRENNGARTYSVAGITRNVNPAIAGAARKFGIVDGQGMGIRSKR